MGLIGFGRIGQATAKVAQAFGLNILAYDTHQNPDLENENCKYTSLDELLRKSNKINEYCR